MESRAWRIFLCLYSEDTSFYHQQENENEELRCVLAIVRHGDRTPKQKLKINITQPCLLAL